VRGEGFNGIGVYGSTARGTAVYGNTREPNIGYAGVFEGKVKVNVLGTSGSTSLCRNSALEIAIQWGRHQRPGGAQCVFQ
jgi:hypothetical protein